MSRCRAKVSFCHRSFASPEVRFAGQKCRPRTSCRPNSCGVLKAMRKQGIGSRFRKRFPIRRYCFSSPRCTSSLGSTLRRNNAGGQPGGARRQSHCLRQRPCRTTARFTPKDIQRPAHVYQRFRHLLGEVLHHGRPAVIIAMGTLMLADQRSGIIGFKKATPNRAENRALPR
jgi:hypothetical protein